jgi:3-polyprenyl-4-hydroxybenzoate decarboxylase
MHYFSDTKERLAFVAKAVGLDDPNEYSVAEKEQINALAKELDRDIELYPVVHCWRTNNGSQLTFLVQVLQGPSRSRTP